MFYHALTGNGGTTPTEDLEPVLLWENSNISTNFAAQTVSLDLSDYAGVTVEFNRANGDTAKWLANRSFIKKGETRLGAGNREGTTSAVRNFSCDNTGVTFENGYVNSEENNGAIIPIKIYGVKSYVVEPQIGDLLWHNDNPTTVLGNKEIAGDYSKYSKILVKGRYSTTKDSPLESVVFKDSTYASGLLSTTVNVETSYRGVIFTDTKINININLRVTSGAPSADNTYCIVTDIYGIE